jgi:hypothetical protein
MQPAQLSLLPPQHPTPPQTALVDLPEPATAEAIRLLAGLIAKAATGEEGVPTDE